GDYDPGDLFSINGGFDYESGGTIISLDAIYSAYVADKLDGTKNFKQSEQLDFRLTASHMTPTLTMTGLARYVARGENRQYDSAGFLALNPYKLYGDEFTIAGSATWVFSEGWDIAPSADLRLVGGNDVEFEKSTIIGFGALLGRKLTDNFHLSAGGKLFTGNADDSAIDLSGYQLTFALTATM
ncbi:MAG: hypothetical protein KAU36_07230, partial [candidate division Zixibacteria bacterium]|nr:hypothetical protein [candidate division Zixibacteria bacterium]